MSIVSWKRSRSLGNIHPRWTQNWGVLTWTANASCTQAAYLWLDIFIPPPIQCKTWSQSPCNATVSKCFHTSSSSLFLLICSLNTTNCPFSPPIQQHKIHSFIRKDTLLLPPGRRTFQMLQPGIYIFLFQQDFFFRCRKFFFSSISKAFIPFQQNTWNRAWECGRSYREIVEVHGTARCFGEVVHRNVSEELNCIEAPLNVIHIHILHLHLKNKC